MILSFLTRIATTVAIIAVSSTRAGASPHQRGQKAKVRFLASSTNVRGAWGLNHDSHLADFDLRADGESILVRLIDEHPNEAPPLSEAVLTAKVGAAQRVRRDAQCDSAYSQMLLRAAPGDLMAIFPVRLEYQPLLSERMNQNSALRWYGTERR